MLTYINGETSCPTCGKPLRLDFYVVGRKLGSQVVGRDVVVDGLSLKTVTSTNETYAVLSRGRMYICEPCFARARRRSLRRFLKTTYTTVLEEHFPQYADDPAVVAFQDVDTAVAYFSQEGII